MASAATILRTSSQKICNPLTWVGTLHPWCRGWRGPYPKLWVTLVKKLPSLRQIGHTNTQVQVMSCLSDSKWGIWTTAWIGQPLCLWHTVSHLWMSTWWSNLVLEPDPSEMGVGNLLQEDWFLRYGKTRGSHPWDSRSLTSHQNSIKQYKCLSPAGRRIIHSPMLHLGTFDNVLGPHQKMELPRGNPFSWLWSRLAKASGDPDWKYPLTLQEGVPIGVDEPTLTSPGVWPTKEELRGSPDDWEDLPSPTGRHNYDSAEAFSDSIKETFVEEKAMGLVEGPFTKQEAANRCGCNPSELCPGPMAAIDEGDKIRTIYDGSFGGANAHIQQNSTEKTTAPTVMDCVHGIHWLRAAREVSTSQSAPQGQRATADGVDPMSKGSVWHWPNKDSTFLLLKADVSKAHRRIKILRSGWKYQVAQIDQQWWVNKVGTYGVASAQLYWGRMAALLLRILYALFPEVDWGFVFVDDFCWVLRASNASWLTPALLGVLLALGTPLSWKKTVLSEINTWLGFVINPSGPFVQMAKEKHVAVLALLKELEEGKAFSLKAIEKALGKIQWATATCPMAKPFLQPFWAWKSAVKTAGVPGKLVRCLAVLLSQLFSKQFPQMSPFSPWSSWTGASDASAEKAGESWIGGWLTDSPEPFKDKVLWFQYKVCQEHHPWAFKKNDPQKRIAALELYGTLFLALLLMAQNPSTSCRLHIPLVSDNQGNVYSILNNATRKMPTAVILMELVYQLYQAGHMLAPAHSRRDDGQWADELTHPNPQGFDPALRVDLTPYFHKLALIPKILEAGDTALWQDNMDTHLWPSLGKGGSWIQNTLAPPCGSRWRCHGRERLGLILFLLIPFLFKQWWSGSGGRVGHKGSPLHTALVERHKFLVLGGLPQQTVFWNQNLTHRNHK